MYIQKYIISVLCILSSLFSYGQSIFDTPDSDLRMLIHKEKTKYILRYHHVLSDTLIIPSQCELFFEGGSIKGIIKFNETKLSGKVDLKGSNISGSVINKKFDASWLCAMDDKTDDAVHINEMIEVCGYVYFPKGNYRLISTYSPQGKVPQRYHRSIKSHIGICKSGITLEGERGAQFVTKDSLGTICIFSRPNDIENSITDIKIKGLTFKVINDGIRFHEFLHTIKTIGVNGLAIENCTFDDFWGDAICLSHYGDNPKTGERTRNQNVNIIENIIVGGDKHNNRNGISVINGKNVVIRNNIIKNTTSKRMPGGIDVEPNNSAYTIDNIRIEGNQIEDVWKSAITIPIHKNASAHHIEILSNIIKRCKIGISISIKTDNTSDSIIIKNNYVDSHTRPYRFIGEGKSRCWIISGNTFKKPCQQKIPGSISVDGLIVKDNRKNYVTCFYEGYSQLLVMALVLISMLLHNCRKGNRESVNNKDNQ